MPTPAQTRDYGERYLADGARPYAERYNVDAYDNYASRYDAELARTAPEATPAQDPDPAPPAE